MRKSIILIAILISSLMITGCSTRVVPPGTIIIILSASGESSIHTKGSYTAYGRDRVYYVDTKLKSFTEKLQILCSDNINMSVDVKWIGSFNVSKKNIQIIKEKVPASKVSNGDLDGYQLSLKQFYDTAMKDIIRANSREIVSKYSTDSIRNSRKEIQSLIKSKVLGRLVELGFPVSTTDIMVSNLDYPAEITQQRKAIKNAQLENERQAALAIASIAQAKREASIAREKGLASIERAKADAKANMIRSNSLTPSIIQMRQWDVLENIMSSSRKGDILVLPYQALGTSVQDSAMMRQLVRPEMGPDIEEK